MPLHRIPRARRPLPLSIAVLALSAGGGASAGSFQTEDGVDVRWSLSTSVGTSIRTRDADPALVSTGNGGLSGIQNDNGNLNFRKGRPFSTVGNVLGDVNVSKDGFGVFLRGKAWYDQRLERQGVAHGSYANGYVAGARLDDSQFERLSRFSGVALLDAYVFGEFQLPSQRALSVRLGNQVVNWGESLFVPGINQYNAFDLTAAHRPGAQVKEILLPVPQAFASLQLSDNASVEAFYQFKWRKSVLDGCGTFWSAANLVNCAPDGTLVGAGPYSDAQMYHGVPALGGANFRMTLAPERQQRDSGQFGVAGRYRAEALGTDFGLYHAQYRVRTPFLSAMLVPSTTPGSVWSMTIPGASRAMQSMLDYGAERTKVTGLSFSTVVKGVSVFGEISRTTGLPAQINGTDLLNGVVAGVGPQAALAGRAAGSYVRGYDLKSKTQAQVSALQIVPRVLGAESLTLIGEVAVQQWSGIGDAAGGARYGRAFVYGSGPVSIPGVGEICGTLNANPAYCENKGFATRNAWGIRLLAEASYSNVFAGVNVKPRLFFSRDLKGWSADGLFSQGRMAIAPGVRFEYGNRYYADLSWTRFSRAKYDEFHDRDFVSVVAGMSF
ncbi:MULTISPECIES: DUF1302 domain-containing protein [unclassified Variovorax]|uniref:DUF1302 domain-containing protein n=1 Tax=unclassified Variovorax TaxID=663243 RepID=UPI0025750377|nr:MULTISPECIES: DUF1302 domain-containing protein [unclassified Variovorax]MDM0091415.1 DUF1302 domain-containing protein [Variovorax sp. J22G40]MDM0149613.1 DUF1302 domain-containing protein [Variovorax sp. J2P1-31]